MLLFLKKWREKTWIINYRRVYPCYALIPNVALILDKYERALHFEWLNFFIAFSMRPYTLNTMGNIE